MDNKDDNPVNPVRSEVGKTAWDDDPATDEDSPPDAWWLRWLKFLAIIFILSLIFGLGFMFVDCIDAFQTGSSHDHSAALDRVSHDTIGAMKFRFWLGAGIGGGLGAIYVARCIRRKTDP